MASLREGLFKLNSASYIESLENDKARQDNEMDVEYSIPKDKAKIYHQSSGERIKPLSDVVIRDQVTTDYYMLCFSTEKRSYLFDEFEGSNSCLIIHDVREFIERVFFATNKVLPGWSGVDSHIAYGGESKFGPTFKKPIDYLFQFEWRFAWLPSPPDKKSNLECLIFNIGNIEDIAEVV